jgi:hypothetical protein
VDGTTRSIAMLETTDGPDPSTDCVIGRPQAAPDCDVCGALASQYRDARARGDYSAASDAAVEMRRHPHGKRLR